MNRVRGRRSKVPLVAQSSPNKCLEQAYRPTRHLEVEALPVGFLPDGKELLGGLV